MPRIYERLLGPVAVIGAFAAFAIGGSALAYSSILLGLLSMTCLFAAFWAGLWIFRSSSPGNGIKQRNPQLFSSAALELSRSYGEDLLWESRQHPIRLWRWAIGFVVLSSSSVAIMATVSAQSGMLFWTVTTVAFGVRVANWRSTVVCVTNRRIIGISGLIKRRHISLPLSPYMTRRSIPDPIGTKLARLRFIAAPYGTLEFRSIRKQDQGVLRITYITQLPAFVQLLSTIR